MACDELIAQCGAWATLPAPSYDYLLSGPFHSSNTTDRSSDLNTAPLASSRDGQTDVDRVSYPTSRASTTALSGDKATTHSTETQSSHAGAELSMDHGSVLSSDTSSMSLFIQANVDTPDREGLTTFTLSGPLLTAANLESQAMAMPAVASGDNTFATWLAMEADVRPLSDVPWSHLVASDPLAAEIEAATGIDTHE
jgi:hypothetical protein